MNEYYSQQFAAMKAQLPGHDLTWLNQHRHTALDFFKQTGLPTRKDEDWKYTPVTAIADQQFALPSDPEVYDIDVAPFLLDENGFNLVFVDGLYQAHLSNFHELPAGCILTNLATALRDYPETVAPHLNTYLDSQQHGFSALNTAFMRDGVFLLLPKNSIVKPTIHAIFIAKTANTFNNIRNLVIAEEGSQATLVESFVSLEDNCYLSNSVTEMSVANNAVLEHYKLQQESIQGYHIGHLQCQQQRSSVVHAYSFSRGGRLVRSDTNSDLQADGAECNLYGLYMVKDRQHVDHHTAIHHLKPHCTSRENYKGVIADKAHAVFNGKIIVAQDAQKTDAMQSNKNLLLSKEAQVDTKPQLEVYADDVKCAHGATVGQLDKDALFYLRARGIDEASARDLLVRAFVIDVIEQVKLTALKAKLEQFFIE
ncbi:MAG: Fe-S cluster assembly protein SufD [Gammaproteobacteria bacterium]